MDRAVVHQMAGHMQQTLAVVAIEHLVCFPNFFVEGQAHGVLARVGFVRRCAPGGDGLAQPSPALRAILMHGVRPSPWPICQGLAQAETGKRGGLASKNNTDPAQAIKASTVKPMR